jgi:hypothetical protein
MGRWVDTLRSGEVSQAKGVLCSSDPNVEVEGCCLGIRLIIDGREFTFNEESGTWVDAAFDHFDMPDTEDIDKWGLRRDITEEESNNIRNILVKHGVLDARDWEEEGEVIPNWVGQDISVVLAELNDEYTTFPVIAEIIERNGWDNSDA